MLRGTSTLVATALMLSACGSTIEDRGISGAGIGAAAGAIIGAVTGLTVVEAVVVGAVGGGLAGAITNEDQIYLGEPLWESQPGPHESAE